MRTQFVTVNGILATFTLMFSIAYGSFIPSKSKRDVTSALIKMVMYPIKMKAKAFAFIWCQQPYIN